MTARPTVTVGLPCHNAGATLADSIRSVFAQEFQGWELLVVDDGSTDGCAEIAGGIADPRLRLVRGRQRRGLAYRLNQIAALAAGRYCARIDADDLMHPDRLSRQLARMQGARELDAVDTAMFVIDAGERPIGIRRPPCPETHGEVIRRGAMLHATVVGKTSWFRDHPYDESFERAQDRELWCRTWPESRFASIDEPLYFCREHAGTLSKYRAGSRANRRVFRRYGRQIVGTVGTAWLLSESLAKEAVYAAHATLGLEERLLRRRNSPLNDDQRRDAEAALARIKSTRLP